VKLAAAILSGVLILIAVAALPSAPAPPQMPSGKDVVSPTAYASLDPVARSSSFQIAVVLKIREGFHINARQPSADYLIATDLRADLPAGFKAGEISYPKGELRKFSFSKTPLNVYENKVIIRMPIDALPDAPAGVAHIPLKLRYQACSTDACLPPVTLPVDVAVNITETKSAARPAHPELFAPQH
jgi:thiol:disulfide interchange protein DsbD